MQHWGTKQEQRRIIHKSSSFVGYAFTSVSIFGSLGNILVILVICRQHLLKNNHYYLVLHLAICDLLCLLGCVGRTYTNITGKGWVTSATLCKLLYLHGTFFTAGVLFMVFMAMLRYRAVFCPSRTALRRWKLHLASATVYMFGVLSWSVSSCAEFGFHTTYNICSERWPSKLLDITYTLLLSLIQFFIPVVFLGMIYWKICRELIKQREKIKSKREETERWLFQRLVHHRSARTFAITFVIFVCFFVAGSPQQGPVV
jgi:hypothetical protein